MRAKAINVFIILAGALLICWCNSACGPAQMHSDQKTGARFESGPASRSVPDDLSRRLDRNPVIKDKPKTEVAALPPESINDSPPTSPRLQPAVPKLPSSTGDENLMQIAQQGKRDQRIVCGGRVDKSSANQVTHYYIPLLSSFNKSVCHDMEGVCRFKQNGTDMLANFGHPTLPLTKSYCRTGFGYGLTENCTHPCRSLAASTSHHRPGELLFFPDLVGQRCGSGPNAMVHDGFVFVNDTGAPAHFNRKGRFDFFWGECRKFANGVCQDPGAREVSQILSGSKYCHVWSPQNPRNNLNIKAYFESAVRQSAMKRGDPNAATFDLSDWAGPSSPNENFRKNRKEKKKGTSRTEVV